ncbi:MAG: zinc ribbon domain-containing protein [Oscillospiraceae bacterium]|nr:zinc ribbon domain-containing protein [Oscillospiraceae bacterium]
MERFCDKCGSLVSGEGDFCPSCGARMSSVFDVGVSSGVDLKKQGTMPSTSDRMPYSTVPTPTPTNNTYQGQSNYGQQPNGQPIYPQGSYMQSQEMTVGQWFLTIFLSCLHLIGLVLLFIWAFSATTPTAKKNYARAMLIFWAIAFVLGFFLVPIFIGTLVSVFREIDWEEMFAALLLRLP